MVPHSVFSEMVSTSWAPLFGPLVWSFQRFVHLLHKHRYACSVIPIPKQLQYQQEFVMFLMVIMLSWYPGTLFRPSPKPF